MVQANTAETADCIHGSLDGNVVVGRRANKKRRRKHAPKKTLDIMLYSIPKIGRQCKTKKKCQGFKTVKNVCQTPKPTTMEYLLVKFVARPVFSHTGASLIFFVGVSRLPNALGSSQSLSFCSRLDSISIAEPWKAHKQICDDMCILPKITIAAHVLPFTARTKIVPFALHLQATQRAEQETKTHFFGGKQFCVLYVSFASTTGSHINAFDGA